MKHKDGSADEEVYEEAVFSEGESVSAPSEGVAEGSSETAPKRRLKPPKPSQGTKRGAPGGLTLLLRRRLTSALESPSLTDAMVEVVRRRLAGETYQQIDHELGMSSGYTAYMQRRASERAGSTRIPPPRFRRTDWTRQQWRVWLDADGAAKRVRREAESGFGRSCPRCGIQVSLYATRCRCGKRLTPVDAEIEAEIT